MINCKHWNKCGVKGGGCCTINRYKKPSYSVCLFGCNDNTNPPSNEEKQELSSQLISTKGSETVRPGYGSRGLGDTIKKAVDKLTGGKIKQSGGCKKRQKALNKLLPYKRGKG